MSKLNVAACWRHFSVLLGFVAALAQAESGFAQEVPTIRFHLDHESCGQTIHGAPGEPFTAMVIASVETSENPDPEVGVMAWSFSVVLENLTLDSFDYENTRVSPGGEFDPFEAGFYVVRRTHGEDNEGFIMAVVLGILEPKTLPPEGNEIVLELHVSSEFPASSAEPKTARMFHRDGLVWSEEQDPSTNVALWNGIPITPEFDDCSFELRVINGPSNRFIRGAVNEDARVDIADAIALVQYLYYEGAEPRCFDAADVNDDGAYDIADAVYLIHHLLRGGSPPPPPNSCDLIVTPENCEKSSCDSAGSSSV